MHTHAGICRHRGAHAHRHTHTHTHTQTHTHTHTHTHTPSPLSTIVYNHHTHTNAPQYMMCRLRFITHCCLMISRLRPTTMPIPLLVARRHLLGCFPSARKKREETRPFALLHLRHPSVQTSPSPGLTIGKCVDANHERAPLNDVSYPPGYPYSPCPLVDIASKLWFIY